MNIEEFEMPLRPMNYGEFKGMEIEYEWIDARCIVIRTKATISAGDILSLSFHSTETNFEVLSIEGSHFNSIEFVAFSNKRNRSMSFLAPFILKDREEAGWDWFLLNTYLNWESNPEMYHCDIYFIYRKTNNEIFKQFIQDKRNKHGTWDIKDGTMILGAVFPTEWKADITLIMAGKYSKLSKVAKKRILDFHCYDENSHMHDILYKQERLRESLEDRFKTRLPDDVELHDMIDLEKETLRT